MRHLAVCSLSFALLLVLSASATGQPTTQRFPGDVVALNGRHLELRIGSGEVVTVQLADNVRVSARSAASLAAIAPGAYIGTTAVPRADGTLTAVEVHVFPEAMRGTVDETAPVVMIEPGDASMLVPGAHVLVTAAKQADGTLTSDRVSVGKNGLVPPI